MPGLAGRRSAIGSAAAVVGLASAVGAGASWSVTVLAGWGAAALVAVPPSITRCSPICSAP
jgi:hypothetical protein